MMKESFHVVFRQVGGSSLASSSLAKSKASWHLTARKALNAEKSTTGLVKLAAVRNGRLVAAQC